MDFKLRAPGLYGYTHNKNVERHTNPTVHLKEISPVSTGGTDVEAET